MRIRTSCFLFLAALCLSPLMAVGQTLPNPILFVTQVPTTNDSATVSSLFANHVADMQGAPRGGDLWIIYPDGSMKNLTQTAGYGNAGLQGATSIAVREPSVHWSGTKALFSMVVGGATKQGDTTPFYWQIYEITGLGKTETPIITRIATQPANYNNVSPIYGTDDRIIFTSDRPRNGQRYLYPAMDEYKGAPTNTGTWSLDAATGDLFQLDNSPSGDFSPFIDGYGRLLMMRWDRLQRDRNADLDFLGQAAKGTFNYSDESATGSAQYGLRTEFFPEPQGSRTDLLNGTNMVGFEFNQFFPWMINEDGTNPETINHIGRHEMRSGINRSITDDPMVVVFNYATSPRSNRNPINNLMMLKEDPTHAGTYYGIDAQQQGSHSGGQIVSITAVPTLNPDQSVVTYVTNRATVNFTPEGGTPNSGHSGFYRNPIVLSNGQLITVHSSDTHAEKNLGTRGDPVSRFTYRLKTTTTSGGYVVANQNITSGITKAVSYWDPDVQVNFNGALWELDPVEVRPRTRPARHTNPLPNQEQQIVAEEGVSDAGFRLYLKQNNLAVAISRDVTHRDNPDHQQPFLIRVAGTNHQSDPGNGKIYDVNQLQMIQGDYVRGAGMTSVTATPHAGRRILPVPMHDAISLNPPVAGGIAGGVNVSSDGSVASFVPARKAISWQLTDPAGIPVVRERYWVTYQPGEIRVCASCHGTNDAATVVQTPIPQNKPEAFRDLLRYWKAQVLPPHTVLSMPANQSAAQPIDQMLTWLTGAKSASYHVQFSTNPAFTTTLLDKDSVTATTYSAPALAHNTTYYWRVMGNSPYGSGDWSDSWSFTTNVAPPILTAPADKAAKIGTNNDLRWQPVDGAASYRLQISKQQDFSTIVFERLAVNDTLQAYTGLAANQTYYWRVSGNGNGGPGDWSPVWSFTTGVAAPQLTSPPDKSAGLAAAGSVHWMAVFGANSYHVQISNSADMSLPIVDKTGVADTTSAFSGLQVNKTFYWRVAANTGSGDGGWSEIWHFSTGIASPELMLPQDKSAGITAAGSLAWQPVYGAQTYHLQVSATLDFALTIVDQPIVTDTLYAYSGLAYSAKYYWHVSATGNGGSGDWSPTWSFTTLAQPSAVPLNARAGEAFSMQQNRPDPFTGATSVHFTIPTSGDATLTLYDVRGNEIGNVFAGLLSSGAHEISLRTGSNLPELADGVYFLRLKTGNGARQIMIHLLH